MTNILVIPDIHGRTFWKKPIANKDKFDHIIFLGDYFDPYPSESITQQEAIENFKELINSFTEEELECKVEFLLGNHDGWYLYDVPEASRVAKNPTIIKEITSLLTNLRNKNQLKINTWITIKNTTYLFTHAGINKEWVDRHPELCDVNYSGILYQKFNGSPIAIDVLPDEYIDWMSIGEVGRYRGGWNRTGGPLWCDIKEFISQPKFSPYYQIFGHTQLENYITKDILKKENQNIDCEDFACLDCKKAFIIDENGIQEWHSSYSQKIRT